MSIEQYAISGGRAGRERLRILSRTLRPQTLELFQRLGVSAGMRCLDMGCGGGDATFELAALVGPTGQVVGLDIDDEKLAIARQEAAALGLGNVTFQNANAMAWAEAPERFDVAYARQLLCHVPDPAKVLGEMIKRVPPGGLVAVEDIDLAGYFWAPACPAMERFLALARRTMIARGGDPDIGPKLPGLLMAAGLEGVDMRVAQPATTEGEIKLIQPITMENFAQSVVADGLATADEVKEIAVELYAFAEDPATVMSLPRYVQSWGRRPAT